MLELGLSQKCFQDLRRSGPANVPAAPIFLSCFTNSRLLKFEGAHAYPPLSRSPKLREVLGCPLAKLKAGDPVKSIRINQRGSNLAHLRKFGVDESENM